MPQEATSAPVSFMDALKQRYGATGDGTDTFVNDKKWAFVGAAKATKRQSEYDRLTLVVLRNCSITSALKAEETGDDNEVKNANMARLEELDLSENAHLLLSEVGKLLPYLPRLTTLQLCDIPSLLLPARAHSPSSATTPSQTEPSTHVIPSSPLLMSTHLSKLVLNNTGFTSLAQLRALIAVPSLEELHLDSNKLTSLVVVAKDAASAAAAGVASAISFPHVATLSLAHNELSDWAATGAAITQAFPALSRLFLTDNKLRDLTLPERLIARAAAAGDAWNGEDEDKAVLQPYHYLKPLTLLCVKDNLTLMNPATVDAIRVLCPQLTTFRITYSALLPTWNETSSRMYVVAALPTVTLLNRGTVRPKERLDSELLYIQRGLQQRAREEEEQKANKEAETQGQHIPAVPHIPYPLVDVLREKHKDVVLSIQFEGDTATTAGTNYVMLDVTLYFVNGYASAAATTESGPLSKQSQRLPSSLTVAKLKALLYRVFQVKPLNQRLSYRSGDDGVLERQTPLDNEQETLGYYGVPDGAVIYVEDTSLRDTVNPTK